MSELPTEKYNGGKNSGSDRRTTMDKTFLQQVLSIALMSLLNSENIFFDL